MKTTTKRHLKPKRTAHSAPLTRQERLAPAEANKKTTTPESAPKTARSAQVRPPVRESKRATVLLLLQLKGGASADQIMAATGWQRHTVRGFLSVLGSKGGQKIATATREDGIRMYSAK